MRKNPYEDKEIKRQVKKMREFANELKGDREKTMNYLVSTGIYDKNGNLTKHYRD